MTALNPYWYVLIIHEMPYHRHAKKCWRRFVRLRFRKYGVDVICEMIRKLFSLVQVDAIDNPAVEVLYFVHEGQTVESLFYRLVPDGY